MSARHIVLPAPCAAKDRGGALGPLRIGGRRFRDLKMARWPRRGGAAAAGTLVGGLEVLERAQLRAQLLAYRRDAKRIEAWSEGESTRAQCGGK